MLTLLEGLRLQKKHAKLNSLTTYSSFINTISQLGFMPYCGGFAISLTQQKQARNELFTCPNGSCRKAFTKPLKALDFQAGSGEIYDACPHCLTRVYSTDKHTPTGAEIDSMISATKVSCRHHLGYLCDRPGKKQIPDECIICKNIVPCMLKRLKE